MYLRAVLVGHFVCAASLLEIIVIAFVVGGSIFSSQGLFFPFDFVVTVLLCKCSFACVYVSVSVRCALCYLYNCLLLTALTNCIKIAISAHRVHVVHTHKQMKMIADC